MAGRAAAAGPLEGDRSRSSEAPAADRKRERTRSRSPPGERCQSEDRYLSVPRIPSPGDEAATDEVASALRAIEYGIVLVGAGIRQDDDCFLTVERHADVTHEHAPKARIAFNTGPTDSGAAVRLRA